MLIYKGGISTESRTVFSGLSLFEVIKKIDFTKILSGFSFLLGRAKVLMITLKATLFQILIFG